MAEPHDSTILHRPNRHGRRGGSRGRAGSPLAADEWFVDVASRLSPTIGDSAQRGRSEHCIPRQLGRYSELLDRPGLDHG